MTMSRCEKEPIGPDHIDEQVHMTMLWCEKKNLIGPYHMD